LAALIDPLQVDPTGSDYLTGGLARRKSCSATVLFVHSNRH